MNIDQIVKEVKAAQAAGKIDFVDGQMVISTPADLTIGGYFNSSVMRHESVIRAIEEQDPEKEIWLRNQLFMTGAVYSDQNYVRMMELGIIT